MAYVGDAPEFDATTIRAALQQIVDESHGAVMLSVVGEGNDEEITVQPRRAQGLMVQFGYGTDPGDPGEVTAEILEVMTPLMELREVIELAEAVVQGRVVVLDDAWGRREIQVTNGDGVTFQWSRSGLLGLFLWNRNWRRKAQRLTFKPYL